MQWHSQVSTDFGGCKALTSEVMAQIIDSVPLTLIALELPGCEVVEALPEAIGRLSALQTLNLGQCMQLQVTTLTNVCRHLAARKAFFNNVIEVLLIFY